MGHAIIQTIDEQRPFSMLSNLYVAKTPSNFESVLCVPINVWGKCCGSLNFDSPKPNAFRRLDFEQAAFYGLVLAQILHQGGGRVTKTATASDMRYDPEETTDQPDNREPNDHQGGA